MSENNPPSESKSPEQMRREAVEILHRHQRGLAGYRGPGVPPPVTPAADEAARAIEAGQRALAAGQLAEALLCADTAVGRAPYGSPLLADAWSLQASVRLRQGNIQAARAAYGKALLINPAHTGARLGLAGVLRQLHQPQRAIPLYLEAIPLLTEEDERARVRLLLADCYHEAGQPEQARRLLQRGIRRLTFADRLHALRTWLLTLLPQRTE